MDWTETVVTFQPSKTGGHCWQSTQPAGNECKNNQVLESLSAARLKEVRINGFMDRFHTGKVGIDFVNQQLSSLLGPSVHEVKWTSLNCRRQVVSYPAYGAHFNKICIAHDKCTQTS